MHLTVDPHDVPAVEVVIDQMAAVGFEMGLFSFGSGFNLESHDPAFLTAVGRLTAYAAERGIEGREAGCPPVVRRSVGVRSRRPGAVVATQTRCWRGFFRAIAV